MGYLLKEALKTVCGVNQWAYAVFWKIGFQNPNLLIWEECYYEPVLYSGLPHISENEGTEVNLDPCWRSAEAFTSQFRVQAGERVRTLVDKMMMDNQVNVVGEGLVGRVAFTGNHQWILSENYSREAHPPEVLNELCQQFAAGMQTVAIIPVIPHGVVQLGSSLTIMENVGFMNNVKALILQLVSVPGSLFSENYATRESASKIGLPFCLGASFCVDSSGKSNVKSSSPVVDDSSSPPSGSHSLIRQMLANLQCSSSTVQTSNLSGSFVESHEDYSEKKVVPETIPNLPIRNKLENGMVGAEVISSSSEALLNQQASFYAARCGVNQCPNVGTSATNYDCLRLIAKGISPDACVVGNGHSNNNSSDAFVMGQPRSNIGLFSSSGMGTAGSVPLLQGKLCNGIISHSMSVSNQSTLSNAQWPAKKNIPCTRPPGNEIHNGEVSTSDLTACRLLPGSFNHQRDAISDKCAQVELTQKKGSVDTDLFQALNIPMGCLDEDMILGEHNNQKHDSGYQFPRFEDVNFDDACGRPSSADDLFDVLGEDLKNKIFNTTWNNVVEDQCNTHLGSFVKNSSSSMKCKDGGRGSYHFNDGSSESGIFSVNSTDHLLDAVVSRVHSVPKQSLDDNVSCRTSLTKTSSTPVINTFSSCDNINVSDLMRGELFGLTESPAKAGALGSSLFRSGPCKEDGGNFTQTSSMYGSNVSSWVEQGNNLTHSSSVSTAYSKKADDTSKSNRKRLKPGENPRPRPKDRQMIQDRVKELREIVPNGGKCSIDALLERTIKHMLFLQSVTKHADKLKQTGESKLISNEGGLLLKDNFEGGATWAYEVGSQSMVCPIIVEDLNPPRQMLVEMLCEERGMFLEIADIIRGLGLTILKGVMEMRSDKIWARFVVEANRDVTRMEIFISLVRLLEQTVKSSSVPNNAVGNDNMMVQQQSFHRAASIPATGRPSGLQ